MRIIIEGKPIPKKNTLFGRGKGYNSQKKLMDDIRLIIKSQWTGKLIEGAVRLKIIYFMPIPSSYSKKKQAAVDGTFHIKRPDEDNLTKLIKDCMSGIVYKDDSQVASAHYDKIYDKNPRTEIYVRELEWCIIAGKSQAVAEGDV
jgi:Holliday junction resolvase RusA-like endonuclease